MAEASTFVRAECRQALVELITARVNDTTVLVARDEPREYLDRNIILGDTVGDITYPAMAPTLPRTDEFTIVIGCDAHIPGDDPAAADQAVQQLASAVMAAVSINPVAFNPLDGLVDGVIDVTIGSVDGPSTVPTAEGYGSVMTVAVTIRTRIVTP